MAFPFTTSQKNGLPSARNFPNPFSVEVTPEELERLRSEPAPSGEEYRLPASQRPFAPEEKYNYQTRDKVDGIREFVSSVRRPVRPDYTDKLTNEAGGPPIPSFYNSTSSSYPRPYGRVDEEGNVRREDAEGNVTKDQKATPTPGYLKDPQLLPDARQRITGLLDEIGGKINFDAPTAQKDMQGGRLGASFDKMHDQRLAGDKQRYQAYDAPLEASYGRFLENLDKTDQQRMADYYRGIERDYETGDVKSVDYDAGKQRFIDDTLESDQNSPQEQRAAASQMMKTTHEADNNKVMDFDENTGDRPGTNRQMTNDARGTRIFESQLDQKHVPEKLRDEDKNMVATNMFDPETGEPGIAGQSPTMVGEGMPKREGASAAYGPPGTDYKRRGMDMGDRIPGGQMEAEYTLSQMTPEKWSTYNDQDRRDLVMNLANRLGYLDGIKNLPEEDQYYAAKRAVFSHLFQTGDGATRVWANDEAELGENSALIDPSAKPMLENVWDENRGQYVLKETDDVKERAEMRRRASYAGKRTKDFSQVPQYLDKDGNYDPELARASIAEALGERTEANAANWDAAMKMGMANTRDGQQHVNVRQNTLDQGRGQAAMGHAGNSVAWRNSGGLMRELEGTDDFVEKAALARNYGRPDLVDQFLLQATAQAERETALDLADKQAQAGETEFNRKKILTELEAKGRLDQKQLEIDAEEKAASDEMFRNVIAQAQQGVYGPLTSEVAFQVGDFRSKNEGRDPTFQELMTIGRTPQMFEAFKMGVLSDAQTRTWFEGMGLDEITPEERFQRYQKNQDAFVDLAARTLGLMQPMEEEMQLALADQYDNILAQKYGPDAIPQPVPVAPTEETTTSPVDVTTETKQSTDTEDLDGTGEPAPTAEEIKKKIKESKQSAF